MSKKTTVIIAVSLCVLVVMSVFMMMLYPKPNHEQDSYTLNSETLSHLDKIGDIEGDWDVEGNLHYTQLEMVLNGAYQKVAQFDLAPSFDEKGEHRWAFYFQVMLPQKYWDCRLKNPHIVFSSGHVYPLIFPLHGKQRCQPLNKDASLLGINFIIKEKKKMALAMGRELLSGFYPVAVTNQGQRVDIHANNWEKSLRTVKMILRYNRSLLLRKTLHANHSPYEDVSLGG